MMWVLYSLGGLVVVAGLFLLVMHILGGRLPEGHVATLTLTLNQPREKVWATVSDIASHPKWVREITKLERLPDKDGHAVWKQTMGRNVFILEFTAVEPPGRMVGTIVDMGKMFGGNWEYELTVSHGQTRVKLTEHGRVSHSIPRAMMHYLFGETTYLRKHLVALAKSFGETPRIEG